LFTYLFIYTWLTYRLHRHFSVSD